MAKQKKLTKKNDGPFLAAALFCERTIEDKQDSALSVIRIIEQIDLWVDPSAPADFPSETQRLPIHISALLSFKTGNSPGDHALRLVMQSPSGKSKILFDATLPFTPQPYGGANLRLNTTIQVYKGGLFWLHVFLDGKRMGRMPLQISIQRGQAAGLK
jgi:hypothetical protein